MWHEQPEHAPLDLEGLSSSNLLVSAQGMTTITEGVETAITFERRPRLISVGFSHDFFM